MSGTTASNSWDDIWAEFDARQLAHGVAVATPIRNVRRVRAPVSPARGFRRLMALVVMLSLALYAASPLAAALQVASAIKRGDAEALTAHVDWASLRPSVAVALGSVARDSELRPMPAFISDMARDMAARLAEPAVLARLLSERLPHGGPAREMLGRIRVIEAGLWEVALAPPHVAHRPLRITLALADPMRLRWEVRAIELPCVRRASEASRSNGAGLSNKIHEISILIENL